MLELLPDGKTFKKLNRTQTKALNNYYQRLHDKPPSRQDFVLPVGLIISGGLLAGAYIFKEEILKLKLDELPIEAGEGVADILLKVQDVIFPQNPNTPEFIIIDGREIGPLSRCQRWEADATDVLAAIQLKGSDISRTETVAFALALKRIINNMKKEKCERPLSITQAQWDN